MEESLVRRVTKAGLGRAMQAAASRGALPRLYGDAFGRNRYEIEFRSNGAVERLLLWYDDRDETLLRLHSASPAGVKMFDWLAKQAQLPTVTEEKEETMNEKNAAAFLRDNARTLQVVFIGDCNVKHYTYVTDLDLKVDDLVVVPANGEEAFSLAKVATVQEDLQIDPASSQKFRWVVAKVDTTYYTNLMEGNKAIDEMIRNSYRANARQAFQAALLSSCGEDAKLKLQQLGVTK